MFERTERTEITKGQMESLISIKELAERLGLSRSVVYEAARAGKIPGTVRVLGKYWGFDPEKALNWTRSRPGRPPRRADGRQVYHVYWTVEEAAAAKAAGEEFIDPRAQAKARRAARLTAKKAQEA